LAGKTFNLPVKKLLIWIIIKKVGIKLTRRLKELALTFIRIDNHDII